MNRAECYSGPLKPEAGLKRVDGNWPVTLNCSVNAGLQVHLEVGAWGWVRGAWGARTTSSCGGVSRKACVSVCLVMHRSRTAELCSPVESQSGHLAVFLIHV